MSATRPVIALTCYLEPAQWGSWDMPAALIPEWYLELLRAAGTDVAILPPGTDASLVDRFDGLVIAGGADIDASLYGAAPHETSDTPRVSRDTSELALYLRPGIGYARTGNLPRLTGNGCGTWWFIDSEFAGFR